jgi:hypothetical protein
MAIEQSSSSSCRSGGKPGMERGVPWAYPYLLLSGTRPARRQGIAAVLVGVAVTVVLTLVLDAAGWLEGPALIGPDARGEALLAAGLAGLVGMAVAGRG